MRPEVITLDDDEENSFSNSHLTDITDRRKRKIAVNSTSNRRSLSVTNRKVNGGSGCSGFDSKGKENVSLPERNKGRAIRSSNVIRDVDLPIGMEKIQVKDMEPSNRYCRDDQERQNDMEKIEIALKALDVDADMVRNSSENVLTPEDLETLKHGFSNAIDEDDDNNIQFSLQRRQSSRLKDDREKGTKASSPGEDFEVDFIVDSKTEDSKVHYLVKWSKYSPRVSSWVSAANLRAPKLIEAFNQRTLAVKVILKKLRPDQESFVPYVFDGYDARNRRRWELLEIQFNWNMVIGEQGARIYIENWSEKFKKPPEFEYIAKSIYSDQVKEALETLDLSDVPVGCGENCECKSMKECCAKEHSGVNYNSYTNVRSMRTITSSKKIQVIECGDHCKCDPEVCRQRVVQNGRTIPLVLFYEGAKGWGVRTVYKIPKRAFVGEYVGEVIPLSEAELPPRTSTYQFGLQEKIPTLNDEILVIDAKDFGNETRFINHSCDPNLHARDVISNKYGAYDIRIAFFAARDIEPGEELTFDYYQDDEKKTKKYTRADMRCRCGASECRRFLPVSK